MRISLERDAGRDGRPVYRQIAEQIRGEIEADRLADGERLPPIRDLARQLSVNRDTVALAYEELAAAGMVESSVGRGTFVRGPSRGAAPSHDGFEPRFAAPVERVLDLERARPRFGSAARAVPMHAVIPDPALYPADAFRRILNRVLADAGPELLLYGGPQGHPRLREVIAERLCRQNLDVDADDIVMCHGASQGISLALRLFAAPGDAVALEEPTYGNVLATVAAMGFQTVPVPMRANGADLAALERALSRPEVKLLYTIPTFHNPMGITTSLAHRRALVEIAARCGKPVVVDGYEMDLRFSGRSLPPLAALDRSGRVVHLMSFSKSLFPGVRAGAIVARGRCVDGLLALKQATDFSDSLPLHAALAEFIASGAYDRHLVKLRRVLRARRDALLGALEAEMPEGTRWTTPEGGYQVWVELPDDVETGDLLPDAAAAGVLFAPGSQFHHDGRASRCLRLSTAMADEAALRSGVKALARALCVRREGASARPAAVQI